MSNTQEQLKELARLTMLTGKISEVHYKNMEKFPFIFFHGVKEVEIDYVIGTKKDEESLVIYKLKIESEANDYKEKRYKSLEKSIQTLFWTDV